MAHRVERCRSDTVRVDAGCEREPCFVAEFVLRTTPAQRAIVQKRLRLSAQVYNRCLQAGLQRLARMRADPAWAEARAMPRGLGRTSALRELRRRSRFTDFDLQAVGSATRASWLGAHVGAHEAQTLATRAFRAAEQHMYGRRGRPRFKRTRRGLDSVEGKGPTSAVRYAVVDGCPALRWGRDLVLPLCLEPGNPVQLWAGAHVAAGGLCHARLVRRRIRGRDHLYAQLVLRGRPLQQQATAEGLVGADLGPSMVAVVTDTEAVVERFCGELQPDQRRIRRLQRRLDRQHRAGSAECFDERGRHRTGRCAWSRSHRASQTAAALSEAHRRMAEHRRSLHRNLINRILSHGADVRIERLSYRAWQRGHFSRSVRDRAPGMFVSELRRKAVSAGGRVMEFDTRTTALSQICICGRRGRKPLSQRVHDCPCGLRAQRDVFSALLARHVDPTTQHLDAEAARRELASRHDIAGRTGVATGLNRRLGQRSAARTEVSVGAGRPQPAATAGEAAA